MSTEHNPPNTRKKLFLLLFALLALLSCDLFDIFPPEIEIVSPREDDSYVGTLSCDIDATDNRSVAKVEVYLDNVSIHELTDAPYKADLDISGQSAGLCPWRVCLRQLRLPCGRVPRPADHQRRQPRQPHPGRLI